MKLFFNALSFVFFTLMGLCLPLSTAASAGEFDACTWVKAENGNWFVLADPECVTWQKGKGDQSLDTDNVDN